MRKTTSGVLLAAVTAVIWGGQFVVGKSALARVDAFPLTTVRYALAGARFSARREYRLLGRLHSIGLPVPEPLANVNPAGSVSVTVIVPVDAAFPPFDTVRV